jgi:hypothetical protein
MLKKWLIPAMMVMAAAAMPARAEAGSLIFIWDLGSNGVVDATYTLTVQENCTANCDVNLDIAFAANSAVIGKYIDSVQFKIDGSVPTSTPTLDAAPGAETDWTVKMANLTAGQCSGGDTNSTCTEFNISSLGFGPISAGTLTWNFNVNWATALVLGQNLVNGNVRAAYNNPDGSNFTIFSPGGGGFGGGGGTGGGGILVPEPVSLMLFGMAALGGAYRVRRRQTA